MNENMKEKFSQLVNKFASDLSALIVSASIQDVVAGFGEATSIAAGKVTKPKAVATNNDGSIRKPRGMAALSPEERKVAVAKAQATRAANKKKKLAASANTDA